MRTLLRLLKFSAASTSPGGKVYNIFLIEDGGLYTVEYEYGPRRGRKHYRVKVTKVSQSEAVREVDVMTKQRFKNDYDLDLDATGNELAAVANDNKPAEFATSPPPEETPAPPPAPVAAVPPPESVVSKAARKVRDKQNDKCLRKIFANSPFADLPRAERQGK